MAKFWDSLLESKLSLNNEIMNIECLLNAGSDYAIIKIIESNFLSWKHRQNFIILSQMQSATGIASIIETAMKPTISSKKKGNKHVDMTTQLSLNDYLKYAEYVLNILPIAMLNSAIYSNYNHNAYKDYVTKGHTYLSNDIHVQVISIVANIRNTLSSLWHKIVNVESQEAYRIVPHNEKTTIAAAKLSESKPTLADDILLYNHHAMLGNLLEKAAIINRINIVYESEWKELLNKSGFKSLISDIGYIINKFGIRHGDKDKESKIIANFDYDTKEKWYDNLFDLFLSAYHIFDAAKVHKILEKLKNQLKAEIDNEQ